MKAISRGLLLFFLFMSMFMLGQFQSSSARTFEGERDLSPLHFNASKIYHSKLVVLRKEHIFKFHHNQLINEPNSSSEETDECESNELEQIQHTSSTDYFSILEKHLESSIKIKYQSLVQAKSETPKVSLFILFHSWKSYDAQLASV